MSDDFEKFAKNLISPPDHAFPVTPSDTENLAKVTRCINVSQTGPVRIRLLSGDETTYHIAAGIQFQVRALRIYATGTNAGDIVASY